MAAQVCAGDAPSAAAANADVTIADAIARADERLRQHMANRSDTAAALRLAREYLALGLFGPAHELLAAAGPAVAADPSIVALLSRTTPAGGRVAWPSRRATFDRNVAALSARGADASAIAGAWGGLTARFRLYRTSSQRWLVREQAGDQRWYPALADHARVAELSPTPPDVNQIMPGPYLFQGIGVGWYLERLYRRTRNTFHGYSAALYVIEPDAALAALALALHDWAELLSDPRVLLFVGGDCVNRFVAALDVNPNLSPPRYRMTQPGADAGLAPHAAAALTAQQTRRSAALVASLTALERRYAERGFHWWAERFSEAGRGGAPLRVLATVSTHTSFLQYSMRDAVAALHLLGCEVRLLTERSPHECVSPETYHAAVREFDPDVFLALDHLRPSFVGRIPACLPMLTWDQDALPHIFSEQNARALTPYDLVAGLPHVDFLARFGCDARQFLYAHMPASLLGGEADVTADELARFACDVSFVSHASQTVESLHAEQCAGVADAGLRRLMDCLLPMAVEHVQRVGAYDGGDLRALLRSAEESAGIRVSAIAQRDWLVGWYLWRICDRAFRHQALEWAAAWARARGARLRIYGNGWEQHPTLREFAVGPAANGRELLCVYRASAINLQLVPAGFLHQRALDGLLAGGFMLTRATAADRRDPLRARLAREMAERRLTSGAAVLTCGDDALSADFLRAGRAVGHDDAAVEETYHFLAIDAQRDYPAEVFPDFAALVFDDAASFARCADRHLADEPARRAIAARIQARVAERYGYAATMRRFLDFVAGYFRQRAGGAT